MSGLQVSNRGLGHGRARDGPRECADQEYWDRANMNPHGIHVLEFRVT
jgi:hypothetical protein